jgi:hypothetical protein
MFHIPVDFQRWGPGKPARSARQAAAAVVTGRRPAIGALRRLVAFLWMVPLPDSGRGDGVGPAPKVLEPIDRS